MASPRDTWLCLLLVLVIGATLFLRVKFPQASRRSETAVLAMTSVLFFGLCYLLLTH